MAIKLIDAVIDYGNGVHHKYILENTIYTCYQDVYNAVYETFYNHVPFLNKAPYPKTGVIADTFIKELPRYKLNDYIELIRQKNPSLTFEEALDLLDGKTIEKEEPITPPEDENTTPVETSISITQSTVPTLVVGTMTALPAFTFNGTINGTVNVTINATNATMSSFTSNEDDDVTTHNFSASDIDDLDVEFANVHITPTAAGTVTLDFIIDGKEHKLFTYTAEEE